MKRITSLTFIALITFLIGIAAAGLWMASRKPSLPQFNSKANHPSRQQSLLAEVFQDFQFVGDDQFSSEVSAHTMEPRPLPEVFQPKHQYIFHRCPAIGNLDIFEEFQNRFRSRGISFKTTSGSTHRMVGGLLFYIEFEDAQYKGYIENKTDTQILNSELSGRCSVDDYVLVVKEVKVME
jgi:hypothetical protein